MSIIIEASRNNIEKENTYINIFISDWSYKFANIPFITWSKTNLLVFNKYTANADGAKNLIIFVPKVLISNLENNITWKIETSNIVGEIYETNKFLFIDISNIENSKPYILYINVIPYNNNMLSIIVCVFIFFQILHFFIIDPKIKQSVIQIKEYPLLSSNSPEILLKNEKTIIIAKKILLSSISLQFLIPLFIIGMIINNPV